MEGTRGSGSFGDHPCGDGLLDCEGPLEIGGVDDREKDARVVIDIGGGATRAAVLDDLSQASLVTRGHVLVTRQTDPGWGPLFCLVSGLVVERGGMLSHGAIIAREFGLPCVVGIANATTRIPQGSVVTVDGDRGRCEVSDAEAAR